MMSKARAFWTGAAQGFGRGAAAGFIVAGLVGMGLLLSTAALGNLTVLFAVDKLVGAFFLAALSPPGLMLTGAAGAVNGAYKGIDEYLEVRDIERKKKAVTQAAEENLKKITAAPISHKKETVDKALAANAERQPPPAVEVEKTQAISPTPPKIAQEIKEPKQPPIQKLNIPQTSHSAVGRVEQNRSQNANRESEIAF